MSDIVTVDSTKQREPFCEFYPNWQVTTFSALSAHGSKIVSAVES